jgi:hypothetical protein
MATAATSPAKRAWPVLRLALLLILMAIWPQKLTSAEATPSPETIQIVKKYLEYHVGQRKWDGRPDDELFDHIRKVGEAGLVAMEMVGEKGKRHGGDDWDHWHYYWYTYACAAALVLPDEGRPRLAKFLSDKEVPNRIKLIVMHAIPGQRNPADWLPEEVILGVLEDFLKDKNLDSKRYAVGGCNEPYGGQRVTVDKAGKVIKSERLPPGPNQKRIECYAEMSNADLVADLVTQWYSPPQVRWPWPVQDTVEVKELRVRAVAAAKVWIVQRRVRARVKEALFTLLENPWAMNFEKGGERFPEACRLLKEFIPNKSLHDTERLMEACLSELERTKKDKEDEARSKEYLRPLASLLTKLLQEAGAKCEEPKGKQADEAEWARGWLIDAVDSIIASIQLPHPWHNRAEWEQVRRRLQNRAQRQQ